MQPYNFKTLTLAMTFSAPLLAGNVLAAPIENWNVTSTSVFDIDSVRFASGEGDTYTTPEHIRWSDPAGAASSLDLGATLTLTDDGAAGGATIATSGVNGMRMGEAGTMAIAMRIEHANGIVRLDQTPVLRSGTLMTIANFGLPGHAGSVASTSFELPFKLLETLNIGTDGVCPGGQKPPEGGCSDFVVTDPAAFERHFQHDGTDYAVRLVPSEGTLVPLMPGECLAVGSAAGCVGFDTLEEGASTLQLNIAVDAVPLPPAVWMFASALLVLGARRRHGCASFVRDRIFAR